ncbi:nuclear transport factor 2 [Thelonectria olida]|uniref:Nuclear transport factor 2 n=1 Tax=Thelonectria olida TaxID=1576542 RepID=A0A9P9AVF5_9HYPO|nr:nuclear transport factor 2 [Thelonectria olida]
MTDLLGVANQFILFYYQKFDENRAELGSLYRDDSMLTFESESRQGVQSIVDKLTSLQFQKVRHSVSTKDAQPNGRNGVVLLVTGHLFVDDSENPLGFSQCFQLQQDAAGSWYVFNDLFKLVMG